MSCSHPEIDYPSYYDHGLNATDEERQLIDALNEHLPDKIIDSHTHSSAEGHFDKDKLSDFTREHMVSTFPVTTLEKSSEISDLMFSKLDIRKVRFAHAFRGIAHAAVNSYLTEGVNSTDRVALFGIHGTQDGIDYTVEELHSGKYTGLKMYYSSEQEPVFDLFEYYPRPILAAAESTGTPIILHLPRSLKSSLPEIKELVTSYPKLQIVLAHAGVTWIDSEDVDAVFAQTAQYPNVMADTAGVADARVLEKIIRHFGEFRILFGSDEPLNLLREQSYEHPELGPRIITDFPYHWVNPTEYSDFHDKVGTPQYNHIMQIEALLTAIRRVAPNLQRQQTMAQAIFHDNAYRIFGFS